MEILKSCPFEEPIGKYEIENDKPMMTNEEWLRSATTEQLAEFMGDIWGRGYLTSRFEGNFEFGKKQDKAYWEKWLKQPHTFK